MKGEYIPPVLLAERASSSESKEASAGERKPSAARAGTSRIQLRRIGFPTRLKTYAVSHLQAFFETLGRMARAPVSNLLTITVVGIALALPTGLHVLLGNVQSVSAGWEDAAQISLFLRKDANSAAIQRLANDIRAREPVASVTLISPDQALDEFRRTSGFGDVLNALHDNPLPAVLVVRPRADSSAPAKVEAMVNRLRARPEVEIAQLDLEWVKRLYALMEIGKRVVLALGILLASAVLLIVGNTIRLGIESRREEIVVQKLIGATNAFVRRPFLHSGLLFGLFGALFAWVVISLSLWLLEGPVRRLAFLYDSQFELAGLGLLPTAALLLAGVVLGVAGAWLAVGRHIRQIEPR